VVDLGEASGTVEAVSLRVTRLRDVNGTVWYVRNGEILRVGNMSQNWARSVLDVNVGYREDLVKVRQVLRDVAHDLWEDEEFRSQIIEEPEVWGVESITPEGVVVRVTLKTAPMEQWAIAREMRERILARFAYEGIEIPIPQRMVWHRDEPVPALPRPADRAIEKHDEWAAAISSSGLVLPLGASAREGQETSNVPTPDDSRVTLPAPSVRLPSQWVCAVRVVLMRQSLLQVWGTRCESCTAMSVLRGRVGRMDR
jgi:hypothetical protein